MIKAPNKQRELEIIAGNVCFYGASKGKPLCNGGERFVLETVVLM